ncbi:hypothetical protein WJX73_006194 [Symbiochloris irregularis]|uniref:Uncharacterized protein n=1 Tax=Symbiochloris irregularis TaxID=706552 RepID=A0AAW1NZ14_9CHLO
MPRNAAKVAADDKFNAATPDNAMSAAVSISTARCTVMGLRASVAASKPKTAYFPPSLIRKDRIIAGPQI